MEQFTINTDGNGNFVAWFAGIHYPLKGDWAFEMNDNLISKEVVQAEAPRISLDNYFGFDNIDEEEYDNFIDAVTVAKEWNDNWNEYVREVEHMD